MFASAFRVELKQNKLFVKEFNYAVNGQWKAAIRRHKLNERRGNPAARQYQIAPLSDGLECSIADA